jgi:uncharacterized repeat protein (TIGR03803 family)
LLSNSLVFVTPPTNTAAGSDIDSPSGVQVAIEDASGNLITSSDNINIALSANPGGGSLSGTLTQPAVNGIASFPTLILTKAANAYTLKASDSSNSTVTSTTSSPFNVTAALAPTKIVFSTIPSSVVAGVAIGGTTGFQVTLEDAYNNIVSRTDSITISLATNPGNSTLSGTTPTTSAVGGIATFTGLSLNKIGTAYTLSAVDNTIAGVTAGTSNSFNITPAAPVQLVFTAQPTSTTVATTIDTPNGVAVAIEDSFGNTVTSNTDTITLSLAPNIPTLSGTTTLHASSGVAIFNNLSISVSGVYYTLTASDASASLSVVSQPFNVSSISPYNFQSLASVNSNISVNGGFYSVASLYMDNNGNIFGTTTTGGISGDGVVFEIAEPSNTYSTLFSFTGAGGAYPGADPQAGLISDGNGNLFGTTYAGGSSNDGTIFELAGPNYTFSSLLSFTGTSGAYPGANPQSNLNSDGNGNLFGTTSGGGSSNNGTVFELEGPSYTFSSVLSFTGGAGTYPGANPQASLNSDGNGNLFGTTTAGGTSNDGTVFELAGPGYSFSSLLSFTGTSGAFPGQSPQASPISDGNGNLFGTTFSGGTSNDGTVFELAGPGHTFSALFSFTGTTGTYLGFGPFGLISDGNGNLFGITQHGGTFGVGSAFELAGPNQTFSSLVSFDTNLGGSPKASLTLDGNDNLFGTTSAGGTYNYGTVFEIPASAPTTINTLVNFLGGNGANPLGPLFIDSSGNLFGTTNMGGAYGYGSVFEIAEPSGVYSTLFSFTGNSGAYPGEDPFAGLISDGNGNLFGTTLFGGTLSMGTVFELVGPSHTFVSLLSFTGKGGPYFGAYPYAGLTSDGKGNLFGTTDQGGTARFNDGTVFELAGPNHTFSSLLSFTIYLQPYSGAGPQAALISDGNGNLFGTTRGGGGTVNQPGDGSVFEIAGPSHAFSTIFSFSDNNDESTGIGPVDSLISDGNGNLFGTTSGGGIGGFGTVFELAGASHTFSTLVYFTGDSGAYPGEDPVAGLTSDGHGNLFGTTGGGGAFGDGTLFELAGPNHVFSSLLSFTGNSGAYPGNGPPANLTYDGNGNLFGTTGGGGTAGDGTLFELTGPTKLSFANQPVSATAGSALSSIQVNIEQNSSNISAGDSSIVTLSIQSGPVGAALGGTTSVAAVNGVATFTNLSLSIPGDYTLLATDGALSPATSNPFTIQPIAVTWTGAADGLNWSNPGNWSNDQVPSANTDVTIGSGFTILLGSGMYSVDSLTTSSPIEIANGATLLLYGPSTFASSLTVDNGGMLKADADPVVLDVNGSAFTDNGTIDLGSNDMIIHNGNISQIISQLGQGLISSAATNATTLAIELNNDGNGNPLMTSFDEESVTTTDVLIKFTYYGDTNLDGSVTAQDYLAIDNAFSYNAANPTTPLTGWNNGDFNYDGVINGDDYTLIDNAFNSQSTVPLVSQAQATSSSSPTISQTIAPKIVTSPPAIAQTESSTPISPFDFNPLDKRKPSMANEIFAD